MSFGAGLAELVEDAAAGLPAVTRRAMFGGVAWFTDGKIFAIVYQDRIGLKMSDPKDFDALFALSGAERWKVNRGRTSMSNWLLAPEAFHDDPETLRSWVARAHALARKAPARSPRKSKRRRARTRPG